MEILFLIISVIAVAAAIAMLISENAVHSALFLVVNFACVAFFYLMLDAPFLAMIQIAVYAGAIMVLFLFVIMLLGAEKLQGPSRQFPWLAPLALGLAGAFIIITSVALIQGQINLAEPTARVPVVRFVNAAPYAGPVDVYTNDTNMLRGNVGFGESTTFEGIAGGDFTISLTEAGSNVVLAQLPVSITGEAGQPVTPYTIIASGGSAFEPPQLSVTQDNLDAVEAQTGRLTIYNAYSEAVNLVDFGSQFNVDDDTVIAEIQPGEQFELPPILEDTDIRPWAFTAVVPNALPQDLPVLFRLNNPEVYSVKRDTAQLLVLANEALSEGGTRLVALPLVSETTALFGSPQSVGQLLFSRYMLPFQLIAVLLLAAMIGAIVLTHKEGFQPRRRDVRRKVMKPLSSAIADQVGHDVLTPQLPDK
jgi:NADH:ubiquinone oxidoreductase subunit 6 (subunit J)